VVGTVDALFRRGLSDGVVDHIDPATTGETADGYLVAQDSRAAILVDLDGSHGDVNRSVTANRDPPSTARATGRWG